MCPTMRRAHARGWQWVALVSLAVSLAVSLSSSFV